MPIRKTSKKSAGVCHRLTASQPNTMTTNREPRVVTTLGVRRREASLGADASAATVAATLLRRAGKSYGNTREPERVSDAVKASGILRRVRSTMRAQAEVAELADAPDSKSGSLRGVWVRFPPSAPEAHPRRSYFFFGFAHGGSLAEPPWFP